MMRERLHIRNLGPLKDVRMDDIRSVMVLVGASGSGKSLILKVLALMRHVCKKTILRQALKQAGVRKCPFKLRRDSYLQFSDFGTLVTSETSIEYSFSYNDFQCDLVMDKDDFPFRDGAFPLPDEKAVGPFVKVAFIGDMRNLVSVWARRGSSLQDKFLDSYFSETYDLWDEAVSNGGVHELELSYLGQRVSVERGELGRQRVVLSDRDGRHVALERGASGQKASVPTSLVVDYLLNHYDYTKAIQRNLVEPIVTNVVANSGETSGIVDLKRLRSLTGRVLFVHVEEPELSLDPMTQISFADSLMATFDRACAARPEVAASVTFTSHSPYWITALNTIVEERDNRFLTWDRLGGYHVLEDGTVASLRDEESHLLMTPNMDAATERIDRRFGEATERNEVQDGAD